MPGQPGADFFMLVGRIIVDNGVDGLVCRNIALDAVEKSDELLVAMALHVLPDDGSIQNVQRRKQGGCAVALVIMGHGCPASLLHWQAGLRAIKRLNLGLFIDRKHDRVGRRRYIQADNISEPLKEGRIVGELELPPAMRAETGAALEGADVLLVEKYGFLGGAATTSNVLAYCGFFQQGETPIKAVGGVADLVLDELCSLGLDCNPFCSPTTLNWIILLEPEAVKLALDRVLIKAGVDVLLHTRVAAVARTADRIQSVTLAGMDGRRRVAAEAFVDATGDANLAMLAGLECRVGNDHGHLQAISAPIRIGGRDLTVPIDRNAVIAGFETYNKIGKYPSARTDGGIFTVVPRTGEMWWMMYDHAMLDLSSESYTKAEQAARGAAHDYVDVLRRHVPGFTPSATSTDG